MFVVVIAFVVTARKAVRVAKASALRSWRCGIVTPRSWLQRLTPLRRGARRGTHLARAIVIIDERIRYNGAGIAPLTTTTSCATTASGRLEHIGRVVVLLMAPAHRAATTAVMDWRTHRCILIIVVRSLSGVVVLIAAVDRPSALSGGAALLPRSARRLDDLGGLARLFGRRCLAFRLIFAPAKTHVEILHHRAQVSSAIGGGV